MVNCDEFIVALDLPLGSRVDRRVPKKLLLENGAPTAADKRYINEGIEELFWLAILKPTTVGMPEYRDLFREILEIAVLRLSLRPGARVERLVELVHRAIPYPVLLLTEQDTHADLSAAQKRWAQNEANKMVLDGEVISADWDDERDSKYWPAFRVSLGLGQQPRTSLYDLYQGWIDTLLALRAARATGVFRLVDDHEQAAARYGALCECTRLEIEIARLRNAAAKEKQVARQVALNIELNRVEQDYAEARAKL